jgi:Na+-driven multidrug efflux pump
VERTFAGTKFQSVFRVSVIFALVQDVTVLTDSYISARTVGPEALAAISLITPFYTMSVFISYLIAIGTQLLCAYAIGRRDRKKLSEYFSEGLILCVFTGTVLTVLFYALTPSLPSLLHVTGRTKEIMMEYYSYMRLMPAVQSLSSFLFCLIIADGSEKLCTWAAGVQLITNIVTSYLFCDRIGMAGISLGSVVSTAVMIVILCLHFLNPHNQLKFCRYLNPNDILPMFKYSINDSLLYLYLALLQSILNQFILYRYSSRELIVFSLVMNTAGFMNAAYDGFGNALESIVNVYRGENNVHGIKKTMEEGVKTAVLFGAAIMILLMAVADYLPGIFGIQDAVLAAEAVKAVRIYCLCSIVCAVMVLFTSYYNCIQRLKIATLINILYLLILPAGFGILFGTLFSLSGIWTGMVAGMFLSVFISFFLVRFYSDGATVPLLQNKADLQSQVSYDAPETEEGIIEITEKTDRDLTARGVDRQKIIQAMMLTEETEITAISHNGKKNGIIECTLIPGEQLTLILRDSGNYSNATDEDSTLSSVGNYFSLRIIALQEDKSFFITSGYNRTVFRF